MWKKVTPFGRSLRRQILRLRGTFESLSFFRSTFLVSHFSFLVFTGIPMGTVNATTVGRSRWNATGRCERAARIVRHSLDSCGSTFQETSSAPLSVQKEFRERSPRHDVFIKNARRSAYVSTCTLLINLRYFETIVTTCNGYQPSLLSGARETST